MLDFGLSLRFGEDLGARSVVLLRGNQVRLILLQQFPEALFFGGIDGQGRACHRWKVETGPRCSWCHLRGGRAFGGHRLHSLSHSLPSFSNCSRISFGRCVKVRRCGWLDGGRSRCSRGGWRCRSGTLGCKSRRRCCWNRLRVKFIHLLAQSFPRSSDAFIIASLAQIGCCRDGCWRRCAGGSGCGCGAYRGGGCSRCRGCGGGRYRWRGHRTGLRYLGYRSRLRFSRTSLQGVHFLVQRLAGPLDGGFVSSRCGVYLRGGHSRSGCGSRGWLRWCGWLLSFLGFFRWRLSSLSRLGLSRAGRRLRRLTLQFFKSLPRFTLNFGVFTTDGKCADR